MNVPALHGFFVGAASVLYDVTLTSAKAGDVITGNNLEARGPPHTTDAPHDEHNVGDLPESNKQARSRT